MTQTAAPLLGLATKLYIATSQATAPTITAGSVTGGTLIGKIKKITPPKPKFGTEDTTTLDTAGGVRTFIKTLQDPGELTIEGEYESADPGQVLLQSSFATLSNSANGAAWPFLLLYPTNLQGGQTVNGDSDAFSGLVTDWSVGEAEPDKPLTFSATVKVTGAVTFTEGS